MKNFIFLTILTIVGTVFLLLVKTHTFEPESYINQETLDMARPLDVTIDIALLKTLGPAYEQ